MASRQFSLHAALRLVPNVLLQELFTTLGHLDFDPGWIDRHEKDIEPILEYLESLSVPKRDEIESALRSVSELANVRGMEALVDACAVCGQPNLLAPIPCWVTVWGRAMFMWLRHHAIFEKAQIVHQVDNMTWWRKRNDLPRNVPDTSFLAITQLAKDISTLLKAQGRGRNCTVEVLKRDDVYYFCAFPDDYVQNVLVHDEEQKLAPTTFRRTMQIVFAYDRLDGSLELYAKLTKRIKEQLEVMFAKTILHWDLNNFDPEAAYDLNRLKDPWFDLTTDPADQLKVQIPKLELTSKYSGRTVSIKVTDPDDDVHQAIEQCLNLEQVPLSEWDVTRVSFCFEFLPMSDRKSGRQRFSVGVPRSCSLRNSHSDRVKIIQKYLKRWKIDLVTQTEFHLVAVGE